MMDGGCRVTVEPGPCKMTTVITATMDDDMNVVFEVQTECESVRALVDSLPPLSPYEEIERTYSDSEIYKAASLAIKHLACPVPCAMVKAAEAASGLGIKRDVNLVIE
ncbi:MAG: hypothetical protein GXX87_04165 [Euryarchaeota archaeon]|nr:hypothetical protein [Euryarchaeota archaeon]